MIHTEQSDPGGACKVCYFSGCTSFTNNHCLVQSGFSSVTQFTGLQQGAFTVTYCQRTHNYKYTYLKYTIHFWVRHMLTPLASWR